MTQIEEILFFAAVIIPVIFIWLFEMTIQLWQKETDPKKRESYSRQWHGFKYWAIAIPPLALFYFANLTQWFKYLPMMMWAYWVLFDLWWNWRNRRTIGSNWVFYPGDGKGGSIEICVFWLSKLLRLNFTLTLIFAKIIVLGVSIFTILKFK
jgi:hypothetical protein